MLSKLCCFILNAVVKLFVVLIFVNVVNLN